MNKWKSFLLAAVLSSITLSSYAFELTSTAFINNAAIPAIYSCRGSNISPPLRWTNPPVNTEAYALSLVDPDAPKGPWVHWLVYNIPNNVSSLSSNDPSEVQGLLIGTNSWGNSFYNGPCSPKGMHRYVFTLYALDQSLLVDDNLTNDQLAQAMQGHILGTAQLTGTYQP